MPCDASSGSRARPRPALLATLLVLTARLAVWCELASSPPKTPQPLKGNPRSKRLDDRGFREASVDQRRTKIPSRQWRLAGCPLALAKAAGVELGWLPGGDATVRALYRTHCTACGERPESGLSCERWPAIACGSGALLALFHASLSLCCRCRHCCRFSDFSQMHTCVQISVRTSVQMCQPWQSPPSSIHVSFPLVCSGLPAPPPSCPPTNDYPCWRPLQLTFPPRQGTGRIHPCPRTSTGPVLLAALFPPSAWLFSTRTL